MYDRFALALDAFDAQHLVATGVIQAGHLRASSQDASYISPGELGLADQGYHPCPKPLQNDQRQQRISLQLMMTETGRCPSLASKARPKRLSDSGSSRSTAGAGTAWCNLPGARC